MLRRERLLLVGSLILNAGAATLFAWKLATRPPPARGEERYVTDAGEWAELLELGPDVRVANRGIAGDTTDDVLARLSSVTRLEPRVVALLIGVNDLLQGEDVSHVASGVEDVSQGVREGLAEDGLHLTGRGYRAWAAVLRPHLARALKR
jgi:lysophospholipase L1-like esterase